MAVFGIDTTAAENPPYQKLGQSGGKKSLIKIQTEIRKQYQHFRNWVGQL
jgi:hypothetical protein